MMDMSSNEIRSLEDKRRLPCTCEHPVAPVWLAESHEHLPDRERQILEGWIATGSLAVAGLALGVTKEYARILRNQAVLGLGGVWDRKEWSQWKATPRECGACRIYRRFLFKATHQNEQGCWVCPISHLPFGYSWFGAFGKHDYAHRWAYRLFVSDIPSGLCVLHTCDNPHCVNPGHLWTGTNAENAHDRYAKERNGRTCKLTKADVLHIHYCRENTGMSQAAIGQLFDVHFATIRKIIHGETWRWVVPSWWPTEILQQRSGRLRRDVEDRRLKKMARLRKETKERQRKLAELEGLVK